MSTVLHRTTLELRMRAHTPDYPAADWIINPVLTAVKHLPPKYWKITGDSVDPMSQAEMDAVDLAELEERKARKMKHIDARTGALIGQGFAYAAKQFSLSTEAQARLMGSHQVRDDPALVYPIEWNEKGDEGHYDIADAADMHGFYLTALGTYRAHVDAGTALKDAVRGAATLEELNAIEDER